MIPSQPVSVVSADAGLGDRAATTVVQRESRQAINVADQRLSGLTCGWVSGRASLARLRAREEGTSAKRAPRSSGSSSNYVSSNYVRTGSGRSTSGSVTSDRCAAPPTPPTASRASAQAGASPSVVGAASGCESKAAHCARPSSRRGLVPPRRNCRILRLRQQPLGVVARIPPCRYADSPPLRCFPRG
jgi:hypothetical protein